MSKIKKPQRDWEGEAKAIMRDIGPFLKEIHIAEEMSKETINRMIYLNILTIEGKKFCVVISDMGFGIVGNDFNSTDNKVVGWYETPYALLTQISSGYEYSFKVALMEKLEKVKSTQEKK